MTERTPDSREAARAFPLIVDFSHEHNGAPPDAQFASTPREESLPYVPRRGASSGVPLPVGTAVVTETDRRCDRTGRGTGLTPAPNPRGAQPFHSSCLAIRHPERAIGMRRTGLRRPGRSKARAGGLRDGLEPGGQLPRPRAAPSAARAGARIRLRDERDVVGPGREPAHVVRPDARHLLDRGRWQRVGQRGDRVEAAALRRRVQKPVGGLPHAPVQAHRRARRERAGNQRSAGCGPAGRGRATWSARCCGSGGPRRRSVRGPAAWRRRPRGGSGPGHRPAECGGPDPCPSAGDGPHRGPSRPSRPRPTRNCSQPRFEPTRALPAFPKAQRQRQEDRLQGNSGGLSFDRNTRHTAAGLSEKPRPPQPAAPSIPR